MNKNIKSNIMICLLLTVVFFMITSSNEIIESVSFSISIWKDNLFPTLFPFFVVSSLLISYGFIDIIGKLLEKPMSYFFHLKKESSFALAASLLSGFPSGAKYTKDLVEKGLIDRDEGSRLLTFTHYSNPLFIMGMIGNILLNNQKTALIILISHVFSGLLTGYLLNIKYKNYISFSNNKSINTRSDKKFGELLQISIFDSLNTMFLLLGVVTIFLIITTIINNIIALPDIVNVIISGILEMTQGVKNASLLNYPEIVKVVLITAIISFGGLSVHTQVLSIISSQKIKYKQFLLARIIHSILASLFVFILYIVFI